jgi:two-component system, NarL family, sensor histidine kinase DesK
VRQDDVMAARSDHQQARTVANLTRLSVHCVIVVVPSLAAGGYVLGGDARPELLVVGAGAYLGFLVAAVRLASSALRALAADDAAPRLDRARLGWCIGFAVAFGVVACIAFGVSATPLLALVAAAGLGAVAPVLRARPVALGVVAIVVAAGGVILLTAPAPLPERVAAAVPTVISAALVVAANWYAGVLLRMVFQLDAARRVEALVAVNEDRLRIARDLHDVFGRTLVVVGLKSELAAELATRAGAHDAASEMREVHRVVDTTGVEMRRVLRGFRQPDFATELDGARALLEAAGVRFALEGEPASVPAAAREAFAWTLRESVTNALRHADATRFAVRIADGDRVAMELRNDGARPSGSGRGTGIAAMRERAEHVGGTADAGREGEEFVVRIEVPR